MRRWMHEAARLRWAAVMVLGLVWMGAACVPPEEDGGEGEEAGVPCAFDIDCPEGFWCAVPLTGDATTGTCEALAPANNSAVTSGSNNGGTSAAQCLSDLDCPRGEVCVSDVCVPDTGGTNNGSTSNNGQTSTNNGTTSTNNATTSPPACFSDAECEAFEECCDGDCVNRGQCGSGGTNNGTTVPPACQSDQECSPSQECCLGTCVARGQCGGGGNDNPACTTACDRLITCSDMICLNPAFDRDRCLEVCNEDPATFQPESINVLSCDEINQSLCQDATFAAACACGGGGGTTPNTVCLRDCFWDLDCAFGETCIDVLNDGLSYQCVTTDGNIPAGDPQCDSTGQCGFGATCYNIDPNAGSGLSCGEIFDCFALCADDDTLCAQGCYNQASPQGQALYDDLADCAEVFCAPDYDGDCIVASCPAQVDACFDS